MAILWEIVSYRSVSRLTTGNPKEGSKQKSKQTKQNKTPLDDGWMMYFY